MATRATTLNNKLGNETSPAEREHKSVLKVGLFVAGGLILGTLVIFLLGREHRLFQRNVAYHAYFEDIDGLTLASPVRLGGLTVGEVTAISFQEALEDTRIRVEFEIDSANANRVRADSIARIGSRGVLGDKTIDVSVGSSQALAVEPGAELKAGVGGDLASMMKASSEVVENIVSVSRDVRSAIEAYTDPALTKELTGTVSSARSILTAIEKGNGALHKVIYDAETGRDVQTLISQASQAATRLDSAVAKVDAMLAEVKSGSGTAHALIYGDEGKKLMREMGEAAEEVATLLEAARKSEQGAVHQIVYGDSRGMMQDLGATANHLKRITGRIDKGEGSLGALINDPTVYEDVKSVLGNVQRNRVLRGLVRWSLSNKEEFEESGQVEAADKNAPASNSKKKKTGSEASR